MMPALSNAYYTGGQEPIIYCKSNPEGFENKAVGCAAKKTLLTCSHLIGAPHKPTTKRFAAMVNINR